MKDKDRIKEILKTVPRIMENERHTDYFIDNIDELAEELSRIEPQTAVMPTEQEIYSQSIIYNTNAPIIDESRMGFRAGAKWYKSQVKVVDLRDFWEWVNKGEVDSYATRRTMVDEYLASKNKENG